MKTARAALLSLLALAAIPLPAGAVCVEVLPLPGEADRLVFEYDAPALAHFAQSGNRRESWIFDGRALRPRAEVTPDGIRLPPPGGFNTFFPAPETEEGEVFALMPQPPFETGARGPTMLFRLDEATRDFVPLPFIGPRDLDVTDAVWSGLFGGVLLIGARDGVYDLTSRAGRYEVGRLTSDGGPGIRTLVDLPGLDAALVTLRPPSDELPARQPVLTHVLTAGQGLIPLDLPLSETGWLAKRALRPSGFTALSAPPGLVFAESDDRATTGHRFVALASESGIVSATGTAVTGDHGTRVAILGGAGFTLGPRNVTKITAADIRIFDGAALRELTGEEQGALPATGPLGLALGQQAGDLPGPRHAVGLVGEGRLYTYDAARGFVETPLAPGAPAGGVEGTLWYAPSAALSVDLSEGAARAIGPEGSTEAFSTAGLVRIRILPRTGEVLILDDTHLRVATPDPCGP